MQYSTIIAIIAAAVVSAQPLIPGVPSLPVGKYGEEPKQATTAAVYPVQTTTLAKVYASPTTEAKVYYAQNTSKAAYPSEKYEKYPEEEPYPSFAAPVEPTSSLGSPAEGKTLSLFPSTSTDTHTAEPTVPAVADPAAPSLSADGNNVCPVNSAVSCCNTEASPFNILGGSCSLAVLGLGDQCAGGSSYCCQTTPTGLINVDLSCTPITL